MTNEIDNFNVAEDIFRGVGVQITLPDGETFLKIKETLTRIGVSSRKEKKLYQSCHILHKRGRYAIVHFKEMFILDHKETTFSEDDKARRNKIVALLADWGLLKVNNPEQIKSPVAEISKIKVIPFKEKKEWALVEKYRIGSK